jgi:hypothetical protein
LHADHSAPELSSRLTFRPVQIEYAGRTGRATISELDGCLPLDGRIDLLWAKKSGVWVSKTKGQAEVLWRHADPIAEIRSLTYDGRYAWLTADVGRKPSELWVLDPHEQQAWQITADEGLPLIGTAEMPGNTTSTPTALAAAIEPRRAIVVGLAGRTWLAEVRFDPRGRHQVRVFHEAKEPVGRDTTWTNTHVAFEPSSIIVLSGADGSGNSVRRIVIDRYAVGGEISSHPLIVNPEDFSISASPERWMKPGPLAKSGPQRIIPQDPSTMYKGANYYTQIVPPTGGALKLEFDAKGDVVPPKLEMALWSIAAPDLKPTKIRGNVREGLVVFDGDTLNIIGKQWWRGDLTEGELVSYGDVPWVYSERGGFTWGRAKVEPGRASHVRLRVAAPSHHYVWLVSCTKMIDDSPPVPGGPIMAQVLFDGSGGPLEAGMEGESLVGPAGQPLPSPADRQAGESLPGPARHFYVMVATSADGRLIATASSRATGSVRVTNANGRLLANLWDHPAGATQVAFSPSGKYLAAGTADGQIGVWSTADFQPLRKLAGHEKPIEALAFSWDDRRLASSCKKRMARLWDLESGEEVLRVGDYMGEIKAMAFAPDGQRLVTTNQGGHTYFWDLETGRPLRVEMIAAIKGFLPDKSLLASTLDEPRLEIVWDWSTDAYRIAGGASPLFLCASVQRYDLDQQPAMYTTMRTWTDRSGQFRVEAALLGVSSGSVRLRTADGRTINVSLDALSQSDQQYIQSQGQRTDQPR